MQWTFEERIDLQHPTEARNWPDLMMVQGDSRAHEWRVSVYDGGAAVDLPAYEISASFDRADGKTIPVLGTAAGNVASVVLPQSVYAVSGALRGVLQAKQDAQVITLASGRWFVRRGAGYDAPQDGSSGGGTVAIEVDATLTKEGKAADAKAVGDYIAKLERRIATLEAGGITVTTADQLVSAVPLDSWKFNLISTTANTAYSSTAEAEAGFDDASWRTVSVPHDWSIALDFNSSSPATYEGGYLDGGDAWYRTTVSVNKQSGRRYVLCFDGVYMESTVYVNGQQVHKNYYGYNPFAVDATEQMVSGVNTIAVFVRNEQPSSRWYSGSGMIRPVELVTLLDDQIRMENIRVTTPKLDSDLTNGETVVAFDAVNKTGAEASATFTVDLYDPDGAKVGTADASAVIAAGETQNVSATVVYRSPKLWHISDAQQRDLIENGKSVSASGNPLTCENALAGKPLGALHVYGKSTQNGVPTPTAPVPIVSAGDGGTVVVTVSDGANNSQTLTLQTPNALPGIPVASGGNYTDENGQQWVCDEVDLARGMYVQRVAKFKLTSSMNWTKSGNNVDRYFCTFARINTAGVLCTHFSAAINGETVGGIATSNGTTIGFAYAERGTTTVDDFKAFLDANEVYIYVPLATPVETALSSAEIAAYKALTTYAPTTVISASDVSGLAASYQQSILPSNAPTALLTASPANLYEAQLSAKVGNRVQRSKRVTYGYRSIRFDKDTGFYLNGIHTKLKGVCVHHDGGCIGAAENRSAIERQVDILTNMGCNAIRLTHNPFGAEYLDVCQRKGVLLVEELFDGWTKSKKQKDFGRYFADHYAEVVTSAIHRDWNNPAVIMWSLGNEVRTNLTLGDYSSSEITSVCTMVNNAVKALDSTRPTTMGNNAPGGNLSALMAIVDVVGINYNGNNQTYQTDRPIYGSETTSALSSRGVYALDSANMAYPSYDNKAVSWGNTAAETVNAYLSSARSCGHFVWTGFDYLGEPTEWNKYPAKSSYFGIVDTCGFPKDIYFMYQSMWDSRPMIHILPHWTHESGNIDVWLYSNCASVELFLNGTSLGKKALSQRGTKNQYAYTVAYAAGTLVANGYDAAGNLIAQDIQYTAGTPAKLALSSDKTAVNTASDDLVYITCDVLDKNGTLCPNANNSVVFTVVGGTIIGTDNGHGANVEKLSGSTHAAFSGKCLCVVKHDGASGAIKITATANGLTAGTINVTKGETTIAATAPAASFVDATNPPMRDVSEPAEAAPTISAISADKTTAALNEEITFTLTVANTTSIRVYIDGSVNRYIYDVTDGTMTYKLSFTDAGSGTRTVAFEPCRGDVVGKKTAETVITLAEAAPSLLYELPSAVTFDGTTDTIIDTGIKMFEDVSAKPKYTMVFEVTTDADVENVYDKYCLLHCMNEVAPYPGLAVRIGKSENAPKLRLAVFGNDSSIVWNPNGKRMRIAVRIDGSTYAYAPKDGDTSMTDISVSSAYCNVAKNLLIGGYQDANGNHGRFWKGTMHNFRLYRGLWTKAQCQGWLDGTYGEVAATNIALSSSSLSMKTGESAQLTATITPSGATQKVTWSVSPSGIVSVSDTGKVTASAAGNATITATVGSVSATCAVVVTKAAMSVLYELPQETVFTAGTDSIIDTGLKLFENISTKPKYTFLFDVTGGQNMTTNDSTGETCVLAHCMEESNPWPGFVLHVCGGYFVLQANMYGSKLEMTSNMKGKKLRCALVVDGANWYYYSSSGSATSSAISNYTAAVANSLLIGGYQKSDGTHGRFFDGTLHAFKVLRGAYTMAECQEWVNNEE